MSKTIFRVANITQPTRTLVTGGAGFLGSHLCERLLEAGNEVICVDNFFTSQRSSISRLLSHPSFELIRHDITFPLYLEVDEIYNLACPASPIHYQHPRCNQHAGHGQAPEGSNPSGLDQRGLR
jgi:UDP-glucuronate decarboxylase